MAGHGAAKKELDPEEHLRMKFKAKCQFRALGRLVMANAYWLIEGTDLYEGDNVKRRVEQAVRGKPKKKQLLNINDKALLNKPAEERTDHEKKYIYRIIGGLKCFKRYPNHVKKKLAAVTYFKYYGPGRTIVRQHQEAHALYFIVTGDVVVSQLFYDDLLQQYISVDVGTMHAGSMFGEVSLLHNIPRTATVTTAGHCELLALMKEDFKSVLQASIQKQWDQVLRAMSAFTYFDALDEVARREGCIVAKMKSYIPNETILGDGVGVPNFVYFVLSGRCQMIESMQVIVTTHLGRNFYTLYDPYVPKEESELDIEAKYFRGLKTASKDQKESETSNKGSSSGSNEVKIIESETVKNPSKDTTIFGKQQRSSTKSESLHKGINQRKTHKIEIIVNQDDQESNYLLKPGELEVARGSISLGPILEIEEELPKNLHTYFMQVCLFNPGSTFGFGENMRDRRIIALTPVECMLLPKVWLLQRNTANIWTRIQYYLAKKIPMKKDLFNEFVSTRRWTEYRDQIVSDVVARSNTVNYTTVHDVPYSIRLEDMVDI